MALVGLMSFASASYGNDSALIDFDRQIRPILSDKCYACHGPNEESREGGLRLDRKSGAIAEADSGSQAIVPGDPSASELVVRLLTDDGDLRMPPPDSGKKLNADEIELVRKWIEQGAAWQEHWAYVPPTQNVIPDVKDKSWLRNPVDLFILDRLERESLHPSPRAERSTLLRRVTFDLTGLPPTTQESAAFLSDDSDSAYETVVDRLLDSKRYGEHMARYWLDAARYGDTHGLHLDNYREMWPYRDWVVRAFNDNMPFDQFVIKQLAGDLLPSPTTDDLTATGFNRCHVTTNEGGSIKEEVYVRNVVDRVVTTGTVFMGMTLECTRCHDHKYDPVTMDDFYSLFAFFNNLDGNAMDGNAKRHDPIIKLPTKEQAEREAELKKQLTSAEAAIEAAISKAMEKENYCESLHDWIQKQREAADKELPKHIKESLAGERTEEQESALREYFVGHVLKETRSVFEPLHNKTKELKKKAKDLDQQIASTLIYRERASSRPSYVLHRGEYDQQRDEVPRTTPAILPSLPDDVPVNRLGLAKWLVDAKHPLTARVTVNRLWQQVFGVGIVKTSEDFGSQGEPPSHPELLNWLAVQFQEDGWDVKTMMKRFVMSATYQQASRTTPELLPRDPNNRLLVRGPRFRLDAEMLRDQSLAVSGLLRNSLGGPSVKPPQPDGLWHAVGYTGSNTSRFKADESPEKIHRRSIYTFYKRTSPPPQLNTFDSPSREYCTVRRERTNTPLQALLLLNDPQYVEAASALAARTMCDAKTVESRARRLFQLATSRVPCDAEVEELVSLYRELAAKFRGEPKAADELSSVGANTAVDVDTAELAAWTMVANLALNLDEVVNKN